MEGYHSSVLLKEAVDALIPTRLHQDGLASAGRDAWYLDLTLGDGGHAIEVIKRGGRVVGIDVDPQALERVRKRLGSLGYLDKIVLRQGNFRDLKNLISRREIVPRFISLQADTAGKKFAGAIFDLGVSSLQLENPERGFSFGKIGPLDMRMDPSLTVRALDLLNALSRKELYELFLKLGEEKYSWAVAGALVLARKVGEVTGIRTTKDLAELIERVYRKAGIRDSKVHPATRVFQALRIAVNDELDALKEGLSSSIDLIEKNGRIVVISFHSLEDRIVKNTFKGWQFAGMGEILTKKPIIPSDEEMKGNSRSRSAKMRIFKKT